MEKQQKKQLKKYISWGLLVVLVALLAFMPLLAAKKQAPEGPQASILSGSVQRSDISSRLVGGGKLKGEKAVEITLPSAVKLKSYLVANGDAVEEGDVIAEVDRVTVMTAITQVQETLEYLAEQIEEAADEEASHSVVAQAGGKVKILYAQAGENVHDVMLRDGSLAAISLDGLMAVQLELVSGLATGDRVRVFLPDGTEVSGRVESNLGGILTVTITDDDYAVGEKVVLSTMDGEEIGSGELYIHSQWNALAYSGTVSAIHVKEGDCLNPGRSIMDLKDTGHSSRFYMLSNQHREYEELMLSLFEMYQSESITAPCGGLISGVDSNGAHMLSGNGRYGAVSFLSNAPNGAEEASYLNYVGLVSAVGIDGLVIKMNPQSLSVTDYKDLSGVPRDTAFMTEEGIYTPQAPFYELAAGEWVQIDASAINTGDILLFAADSNGGFVWVIRVARGASMPEEPEVTPPEPSEPPAEEEPEQPGDQGQSPTPELPGIPSIPNWPSGGFPQLGGFGYGGGMVQEEKYELYGLDTVVVASVNPQEEMTVEISIDELDITKIFVGQRAQVTVDALGGESFEAEITRISNSGINGGGNSKFTVELGLAKSGKMLPGMNASVVIELNTVSNCLSVPVAALTEMETKTLLYTSFDEEDDMLGSPIEVCIGVSDGEMAEIVSEIEEGTVFYYSYYDTVELSKTPEVNIDFGMR